MQKIVKKLSKHSIQINEDLYNDILSFCKANGEKINIFCSRILKEYLLLEKYGDTPFPLSQHHTDVTSINETIFSEENNTNTQIDLPFIGQLEISEEKNNLKENNIKILEKQEVKVKKRRL